ncbi:MAG: vWA domain-containing protein [Candidatus Kapaibacterium sp.]
MIRLEHIDFLWGLLAIPLFVMLFYIARLARRNAIRRFGDPEIVLRLFPDISPYKPLIKFTLAALAFAFIVVGIANPQIGSKLEEAKREGIDVMIALDVSNSMLAEDVRPSRLDRARQSVLKLIDNLRNDRIGLVVFAGEAYLQLPLTTDYSAAKLFTSTVGTEMVPTQGTAMGEAINLAIASFEEDQKEKEQRSKALIIITDGENHEDDALGAAKEAAEKGIIIHTIGVGSADGGPIPIYRNDRRTGYRQNDQGETIVTKLNAQMLQQIAAQAGGRFLRSSVADPDLSVLVEEIAKMEKTEFGAKVFTDYEDRFQYFIAAGILLLLIEMFFSERRNKLITSLNIFGEKSK